MRNTKRKPPCTSSIEGDIALTFYGLQEDDLAAYLLSVKVAFANDEDSFFKLINLFKDYKAQKIAVHDLVKEAKILFKHHPDLLLAFNAFLPETEKVAVDISLHPLEQECLDFISKLKSSSSDVQMLFFKTLSQYGQGEMSCANLKKMVFAIPFIDKSLLSDFNSFIPCESNLEKGASKRSRQNKEDLTLEVHTKTHQDTENSALKAPRRKTKRIKCNFPELVFNKEIVFFEKAKAKLQERKRTLNELFTWFEKYLQGSIVSCEFQREVKRLCPNLAEDADKLFVHEHPSYSMLRKKERCAHYKSKLAKEVLNDYCGLFKYDLTEFYSQAEQEEPKKRSKRKRESQELEQKSKQDQDIESSQDRYDAERLRNENTLKEIKNLKKRVKKGSNVDLNTLLQGFCFTSVKQCCGEDKIRLLKAKDAGVLSGIRKNIKKRQKKLKKYLKKIEEAEEQEKGRAVGGPRRNSVKKQQVK